MTAKLSYVNLFSVLFTCLLKILSCAILIKTITHFVTVMKIVKYNSKFVTLIDLLCTISTLPWLSILSLFLSCYWSSTYERKRPWTKVIPYAIYGPILGLFVAFLFPFAVIGFLIWIVTCNGKYKKCHNFFNHF